MSRLFGNSGADLIVVDPSSSVPFDEGPFTVMALVMMTSNLTDTQWILQGYNASNTPVWGLLASGGKFYNEGNFGSGNGSASLNEWTWICFTKQAGSVQPRWSFHNLTAATAWSHVDDTANVSDGSGPPVKIVIGGRQAASAGWRGNIATIAVWDSVLTDSQIEAAAVSAIALHSATPNWGILLNQTSTATDVTDLSGNGATQSAITGTSVSASEPPGWDYSLTPAGPTFKIWNGSAEVAGTVKLWNGTAEVALSLDSIV